MKDRAQLEAQIREHHKRGEFHEAATVALEGYGGEILGFLVATHRDQETASEIFSRFCEALWKGLERFEWRASFRTWAYTLARHTSHRFLQDPARRRARQLESHELSNVQQKIRDATLPYLKTEVKDGLTRIRERLSTEDQELLILRVDRKMSWQEVAEVTSGGPLSPDEMKKASSQLRKRFQRLKGRLRKLAQAEGLIPGEE